MWVRIPASPKKLDGNYGPLDGRKTKENNKDSQMGQVTPKKYYFFKAASRIHKLVHKILVKSTHDPDIRR
jgi:hypothetical protein